MEVRETRRCFADSTGTRRPAFNFFLTRLFLTLFFSRRHGPFVPVFLCFFCKGQYFTLDMDICGSPFTGTNSVAELAGVRRVYPTVLSAGGGVHEHGTAGFRWS